MAKKKPKPLPYWLAAGDSRCTGCNRTHVHSVEVRCIVCDRVQCTFCVVVEGGDVLCSSCQSEGGSSSWRRARSGKA